MNDVSKFEKGNVIDTCSLWNLLSSRVLESAADQAGIRLCSTEFVRYECLHRPGQRRPEREELQKRLRKRFEKRGIDWYPIDIEDLQDVEVLRNRKRVSLGELSVIVFARKTGQAVLTDDSRAQKLARQEMAAAFVQSTPHLFGWLYFRCFVGDADKDQVVADLASLQRSVRDLDEYHREAQRCRALAHGESGTPSR